MPPDPHRLADTRAWFVKATRDLRAAEVLEDADPGLAADVLFHAQQAAEKAMKGFLTWHDRPFRKTHNLVEIGEAVAALEPAVEPLLRRAAALTEYAFRFRYPGDPDEPDPGEATAALGLAREVVSALLRLLPPEIG